MRDDARVLELSKLEEGHTMGVGGLAGRMTSVETSRRSLAKFVELEQAVLHFAASTESHKPA
jgi:hypothetical protein